MIPILRFRGAAPVPGFTAAEAVGQNVSILMPSPTTRSSMRLSAALPQNQRTADPRHRPRRGQAADGMTFPHGLSVGGVVASGRRLFTNSFAISLNGS